MFLCEVALGRIHPVKLNYWHVQANTSLPSNCHSLKTVDSKWEPDAATSVIFKGNLSLSVSSSSNSNLSTSSMDNFDFKIFLKTTFSGLTVPLGRAIENILPDGQYHGLDHNEFVVFREDQVKLRYLIQYEN